MPTPVSIGVLAALLALVLLGMRRGWLARARRSAAWVPDLPAVPPTGTGPGTLGGARTAPVEATYVSSTRAGDWLDRVPAHGLGARSHAVVQVFDAGVLITRTGAPDVFVPSASLRSVGTTAGIAGKFTGGDGVLVLTWTTGADDERGLDTGLRVRRAADRPLLLAAAGALIDPTPPTASSLAPADPAGTPAPKETP